MREKTTKTAFRAFLDSSGQKEELWLSEMARQGWFLKSIPVLFYRFKKGQPGDWVYRIDYRGGARVNRPEYLGLFKDAGWEFAASSAGRYYFRTKRGQGSVPEIFTDKDSRVSLYRRIVAGSTTLLVIMLMDVYSMLINHRHRNWFSVFMLVLLSALALLFAFQLVQIMARIKRIKKGQARPETGQAK
jgi:hypothetical protein